MGYKEEHPISTPLESPRMLRPIDRSRRDGPLYPGSSRTLRDCIVNVRLEVHH